MYENIKYEVKESIAYVTVNRPQALNALNMDVLGELYDVFSTIEKDADVKAVVLTGEGRAFVAGADIAQMYELSPIEGREMMTLGHKVMNLIESIEKPVIAAVNGFALGGGCELSMACDIRIASEKAKFGQPEVGLGIIPGFGGTQRLARLVGKGMAKYLIMSAETIPASEAYRIGLVEKVVAPEELLPEAEKLAKTIASKAPVAIGSAKTAINNGYDMDKLKAAIASDVDTIVLDLEDGVTVRLMSLEQDESGDPSFSSTLGTDTLKKYAVLFGLGDTSGLEIPESKPQISDETSVLSAIGQGNNNYTTSQLARYITAIANKGTVYNLSLLDKVVSVDGETVVDFTPEVKNTIDDVATSSWNAVHNGMRKVISVAQAKLFSKLDSSNILVSGKTGTAQQSSTHPDHGLFVGFAESDNPEVAFAIRIANGYSSTYAAEIGSKVMQYYYQVTPDEELITGTAAEIAANTGGD